MLEMFRWTALIAAVVMVVAIAGAVVSSQLSPEPSQQHAVDKDHTDPLSEKSSKTLWDRWFPDSISLFTLFLVVFTAALAGAGIVQLKYLERAENVATASANAAKQSAEVARRTLVVTNRPWLKITDVKVDGNLIATRGERVTTSFIYSFSLKNIGNSRAQNIQYHTKAIPSFEWSPDDFREFCEASKGKRSERNFIALFPGDTSISFQARGDFANRGDDNIKLQQSNQPTIYICATYEFGFSDRIHTTGVAYSVGTKPGSGIFAPLDGSKLTVSSDDLVVRQDIDLAD